MGSENRGRSIKKKRANWPNNIAHVFLSMAEQLVDRLINEISSPRLNIDPRTEREMCVERERGLLALVMKKIRPKKSLFCEMLCL